MLMCADTVDPCTFAPFVYLFHIWLNSECWMQRNGFRAYDGVSHNATTLDECQAACANDNTCAAIDWEPSSVGESCRISTSTDARETVSVAHYELKRICLRS